LGEIINDEGRRKRGRRPYAGLVFPATLTLDGMLGHNMLFCERKYLTLFLETVLTRIKNEKSLLETERFWPNTTDGPNHSISES
jgi:hypothetical protein